VLGEIAVTERRAEVVAGESYLGDMYLRLERLEAEVSRLRPAGETKPSITLGAITPPITLWPAPRTLPPEPPKLLPASAPAPVEGFRGGPDVDMLRTAIDLSPVATVALDGRGLVRLWNAAAERLLGWPANEVIGAPPPFLPVDRREEHASLVRYPRSVIPGQDLATVRLTSAGAALPVRLTVTQSRCGGVVFTLRPERPAVPRLPDPRPATPPEPPVVEAGPLPPDADTALLTLGRSAAAAAHALNNTLTAVRGFAGLLGERLRPAGDPDGCCELARDILAAAELGTETCRHLLGLARPAPGTPEQTDLVSHVSRYEHLLRRVAGPQAGLRLALDPAAGSGQVPHAEFAQVLFNLVQDAGEAFTAPGGAVAVTTATEEVEPGRPDWPADTPPGHYAVLEVAGGAIGRPRLGRRIAAELVARHGGHLTTAANTTRVYFRRA
jgi:PAS domain S-box-containing protein